MLQFTTKSSEGFNLFRDKYVITDPCYIFDDDTWDKLIDEVFFPGDDGIPVKSGIIVIDGWNIWYGMTRHGDGEFPVMRGEEEVGGFGVDAGMYAIIPFGFFEKYSKNRDLIKSESAVSLIMSGIVVYDKGDLHCGDITVITSS